MTLLEYRKRQGITLEELAGLVGVTKQALALIESGQGCRLVTAKRIVDATAGEVRYEDLLLDPASNGPGNSAAPTTER